MFECIYISPMWVKHGIETAFYIYIYTYAYIDRGDRLYCTLCVYCSNMHIYSYDLCE